LQVNKASRQTLSSDYFESMYNAEIVVTANPAHWEGDFRLWEALASGALVFVDEISTPMSYPLVHGENIIYFSSLNKTDFMDKLHYYMSHQADRERVARQGYMHVLRYHRTANMVDYILRSAHVKLLQRQSEGQGQGQGEGQGQGQSVVDIGRSHNSTTPTTPQCLNYTECGQQLAYELKKRTRIL
jgi:hypothetical protein